jgi:N-acyl-L-homoserine lactone synthetase
MSLLIRSRHRDHFRTVLADSFRLRREVFVDRLGWSLPDAGRVDETGLEYDAFDGGAAMHLVNLDARDRVIATVRITPSLERNLTCDSLAARMGVTMPRGAHIVELSRMCADPRLTREERRETMLQLRGALGLLFLQHGWSHSIGIGYDHHIQPLIRSGMAVQVLGPPALFPGDAELSFAVIATDPDRPARVAALTASGQVRLDDPDEDASLFARYGDRAVA